MGNGYGIDHKDWIHSEKQSSFQGQAIIIKTEYIAKDSFPFKDKPTVNGTNFGYLPKMVTTSKGSIGSLLASSFCEHINSQANQVYSCVRCSVIVTVSVCLRVSNIHIMITCVLTFYCVSHGYCAATFPTPHPTHRSWFTEMFRWVTTKLTNW